MQPTKPKYYPYLPKEDLREITEAVHQVMKPKGAFAIASNMGADYQDMMNRINHNQKRSPRKLELVVRILDESGYPDPFLDWIAGRYGFVCFRKPQANVAYESLFRLMTEVGREMGELSAELLRATEDGTIDAEEFEQLQKEIDDLIKASMVLSLAIKRVARK